ncbi:MAG: PilZ domain-containing protein [Gammaproteobacteria bacterium]
MSDQRKAERKQIATQLPVVDVNTGHVVGDLADLSPEGFMILARMDLPMNAVFQLSVALPKVMRGVDTLYFGAESLWCSDAYSPGLYWVGFQFIDISPQDQEVLEQFLETV